MIKTGMDYFLAAGEVESPRKPVDGLVECPCCKSMSFEEAGVWDICSVCGWEDDPVQEKYPEAGGANKVSLRQAQENFARIGVSDPSWQKPKPR